MNIDHARTLSTIVRTAAELRRAQIAFFANRNRGDLLASKSLEQQLDGLLVSDEAKDALAALDRVLSSAAQGAAAVREPIDDPHRGAADQVVGNVSANVEGARQVVRETVATGPVTRRSVDGSLRANLFCVVRTTRVALTIQAPPDRPISRLFALNMAAWLVAIAETMPTTPDAPLFDDFLAAVRSR